MSTIDLNQQLKNNESMLNSKPPMPSQAEQQMFPGNDMAFGGKNINQLRKSKYNNQESVWGRMKLIMIETGLDTTAHGIPNILGNPMWSFKLDGLSFGLINGTVYSGTFRAPWACLFSTFFKEQMLANCSADGRVHLH